jgi:uncharacterized protein YkwD
MYSPEKDSKPLLCSILAVLIVVFINYINTNSKEKLFLSYINNRSSIAVTPNPVVLAKSDIITLTVTPSITPLPTTKPTPQPIKIIKPIITIKNTNTTVSVNELLQLINNFRSQNGKRPLTLHTGLTAWAESRSSYLASIGYLDSHNGFKTAVDSKRRALNIPLLGENIAYTPTRTAQTILNIFTNSPGHRDNILRTEYSLIGIGLTTDNRGYIWVSTIFGGY